MLIHLTGNGRLHLHFDTNNGHIKILSIFVFGQISNLNSIRIFNRYKEELLEGRLSSFFPSNCAVFIYLFSLLSSMGSLSIWVGYVMSKRGKHSPPTPMCPDLKVLGCKSCEGEAFLFLLNVVSPALFSFSVRACGEGEEGRVRAAGGQRREWTKSKD